MLYQHSVRNFAGNKYNTYYIKGDSKLYKKVTDPNNALYLELGDYIRFNANSYNEISALNRDFDLSSEVISHRARTAESGCAFTEHRIKKAKFRCFLPYIRMILAASVIYRAKHFQFRIGVHCANTLTNINTASMKRF